jgi:hypothetical protein
MPLTRPSRLPVRAIRLLHTLCSSYLTSFCRQEGPRGNGQEGWRQGPLEHWWPGHQEERQEISSSSTSFSGVRRLDTYPFVFLCNRTITTTLSAFLNTLSLVIVGELLHIALVNE